MKRLINFTNDESGAVTVDWVVLTAAIVGIAIAVITLVSGGVEDASEGINSELEVASNFTFGGSAYEFNGQTWSGYLDQASANGISGEGSTNAFILAGNDSPAGYGYTGGDDTATGHAIYMSTDLSTVVVGGETMTAAEYTATSGRDLTGWEPTYFPET